MGNDCCASDAGYKTKKSKSRFGGGNDGGLPIADSSSKYAHLHNHDGGGNHDHHGNDGGHHHGGGHHDGGGDGGDGGGDGGGGD